MNKLVQELQQQVQQSAILKISLILILAIILLAPYLWLQDQVHNLQSDIVVTQKQLAKIKYLQQNHAAIAKNVQQLQQQKNDFQKQLKKAPVLSIAIGRQQTYFQALLLNYKVKNPKIRVVESNQAGNKLFWKMSVSIEGIMPKKTLIELLFELKKEYLPYQIKQIKFSKNGRFNAVLTARVFKGSD